MASQQPVVRRSADASELAEQVTAHLIGALARVQATGRVPSVVLTGGGIAEKIHAVVAGSAERGLVDWSRVDFWFSDERFVPSDHPERNARQAAEAMLDHLPVDPARVHAMAPSDGEYGEDVDAAAAGYAQKLRKAAGHDEAPTPTFDIMMLGIGPDGHCASLFPGRREMYDDRPVVAVRDSPKPPTTRITLTMATLGRSRELWFVAAGNDKAQAVRDALAGADPVDVPAAGPEGLERTQWFLDEAAASLLPADLIG